MYYVFAINGCTMNEQSEVVACLWNLNLIYCSQNDIVSFYDIRILLSKPKMFLPWKRVFQLIFIYVHLCRLLIRIIYTGYFSVVALLQPLQ